MDEGAADSCSPVMCEIDCLYGFQTDENGCEVCLCVEEPDCPLMTNCGLYCSNGYATDENGCDLCRCAA